MENFNLGALPDTRPESEKKKDYLADEIMIAGAPAPFQNKKVLKLTATVYSQEYTSSCVPHGFYTQLEYEGIIPKSGMSQLRAYRKRINYPGGGSIAVDMYEKIKAGQSPNSDAPVLPRHTEAMANSMNFVEGSKLIKDFQYFQFSDYSKVAEAVASGKAIAVYIYASEQEWSKEYVDEFNPNTKILEASVRHCVVLIPSGDFTENNKKWFSVHDSAAFGGRHLRYMSLDFFLNRCYFAAQVFAKGEMPAPQPPAQIGNPTTACKIGDRGQAVSNLQAFLIKGGFLEKQYLTGYYGALTAKAVLWWQLFNHSKFTDNIPALLNLKGEYWGKQSIGALSK